MQTPIDYKPTTQSKCANCNSSGWVCEDHSNMPWGDGDGCCGGAGSPCTICNPCDDKTPPRMVAGSKTVWDITDGWRH